MIGDSLCSFGAEPDEVVMRLHIRFPLVLELGVALVILGGCGGAEEGEVEESLAATPAAVILSPADGASLDGPDVQVDLGVENIALAAAGVDEPGTGHLHLFFNRDLTPVGEVIPAGDGIVHLGRPQSGYLMEGLAPGDYTIIAVLGDWAHVRLADARTDTVRIVVR